MIWNALLNIAKYDSPKDERCDIPRNIDISFNYFTEKLGATPGGGLKQRVLHLGKYYIRKKHTYVGILY